MKPRSANLVPVITFGENDLFIQLGKEDDSTFRRIQNWIKNKLGFPIPIFYGRGIFNYDFGLLPHRKPITSVGKPSLCVVKAAAYSRVNVL